jgi:hypothetical protein
VEKTVLSQHNKPGGDAAVGMSRDTLVIAAILVIGAAMLRGVHLDQPLLNFHPTRQYRSALIARACYFDRTRDAADPLRQVAAANRALQPVGEPPVMEWLSCATNSLLGYESLPFARAYAALFWIVGSLPLYAMARRITSPTAALAGLAVYLFLPYGVVASRAFQPDALMTCCALWAVYGLWRYYQHPALSSGRGNRGLLAAAALGVAVAAIVKPMSVFVTLPAAAGLATARFGTFGALRRTQAWAPVLLGLVPAIAYYGYGAMFGTLARDQMRLRFVPSLIATPFFFDGLATQVRRVFGLPIFLTAIAGTALAPRGVARSVLVWFWIGYAAFAIAFTYHMPTHDYYHLPFIALAGLATAAAVHRIPRPIVHVVVAVALAAWGAVAAWPRLQPGALPARVALYQHIGDLAEHTTRAVFLDLEYGYPLMYHGMVSGDAWPNQDDLAAEAMGGAAPVDAATRLETDYSPHVTYFIVTDLASLAAQADLRRLLAARTTVVRQTPDYHIYRFNSAPSAGSIDIP